MKGWKKCFADGVRWAWGFVTANPDLVGKAIGRKAPSFTVGETRKTLTNIERTKKTKGETL